MACVWPRALQMHPVHTSQSIKRLNRFECDINVCFLCMRVWFSVPRGGEHNAAQARPYAAVMHIASPSVLNERKAHVHI